MNSRTESFIGQASDNDLRIALHYQDAAEIINQAKVIPMIINIKKT